MKKHIIRFYFILLSLGTFAQGFPPILTNFRVEEGNASRVYFDSSEALEGSSTKGFKIYGKTISSARINSGSKSGHYFTVSSPFTFWDNSTIRYEGGSDFQSNVNSSLNKFSLNYIKNFVPEPKGSGSVYFVSLNGNNKNAGQSEKNAWRTLTYASSRLKAGDVVYIKSGDYGTENIVIKNSGTSKNPIKFIGYKDIPGDYPSLKRAIDLSFKSSEMPLFKNGNSNAIACINKSYILIKNLQIENYKDWGIKIDNSNFVTIDNVYLKDLEIGVRTIDKYSTNNRVINSYIANCKSSGVRLDNQNNLIENVWAVSSKVVNMDYYLSIHGGESGENNIIRNCYVERYANDSHNGHGYSFKGGDPSYKIQHSLIENSEVVNCGGALEFRHSGVKHNVARNIKIRETKPRSSNGIKFRESASYNIVENSDISGEVGVRFENNEGEDLGIQTAGSFNKVINTVFHDLKYALFVRDGLPDNKGNEFINCTFYNIKNLYSQVSGSKDNKFNSSNKFINCAFEDITNKVLYGSPSFVMEYSNFWNHWGKNGSSERGRGNISVVSKFVNSNKRVFKLDATSKLIDAGKITSDISLDCVGSHRPQGNSHDIGAFEYIENSDNLLSIDAGEDVVICKGETISLKANGSNTYKWSTGEFTQEIQVSPQETTVYSVSDSDVNLGGTDDVKVTVIDLKVSAGQDVTINKGDEVILTAIGGDSFIWSNGKAGPSITISPEATTLYSVTVSQGGCSLTDDVLVTVNSNSNEDQITVLADAGPDQNICLGESIILSASGGDSYLWSNGESTRSIEVNPTESAKYTVTVSMGLISDTDDVIVNIESIVANAGKDISITQGESIELTANGGAEYLWSNGANTKSITVRPENSTIYSVRVSNGNCHDTDEINVTVMQEVIDLNNARIDAGEDETICLGESLNLKAQGGNNYLWSTGESGETILVNPIRTSTFSVTTNVNGESFTDSVTITVKNCISSTNESEIMATNIQLYPNPTTGILKIQSTSFNSVTAIHLINMNGKILYHDTVKSEQGNFNSQLDLSNFTKGIYFIRFLNEEEQTVKKIVLI